MKKKSNTKNQLFDSTGLNDKDDDSNEMIHEESKE